MIPEARPRLRTGTLAALDHAAAREWIDAADRRVVEILAARAGEADADALALVTAALCRACAEGNLCLPCNAEDLAGALRDFLPASGTPGVDPALAGGADPGAIAARFLADADSGRLDAVLRQSGEGARPLLRAGGNLYFHRHGFALREIARALRARTEAPREGAEGAAGAEAKAEAIGRALRETLEEKPLRPGGGNAPPLAPAKRQKWALAAALHARVFVLSGGPGTGKTTWTASWLRALLRLPGADPERVRLCAPTGRAAQRLQESLRASLEGAARAGDAADAAAHGLPVTTLHNLLGYRPRAGRFARGPEDPLDADWVLVDEASMVDVFLLAALVRALPGTARLVLVGDADQLPPVDAGSVLGELLPDDRMPRLPAATRAAITALFPDDAPDAATEIRIGEIPSVTLDESHRARGEVVPLTAALLRGDANAILALLGAPVAPANAAAAFDPGRSLARIAAGPGRVEGRGGADADLAATLHAWAGAVYAGRREAGKTFAGWLHAFRAASRAEEARIAQTLWIFLSAARVLAPLRRGTFSAASANRILRARFEPEWGRRGDTPGRGFHGAPVLITRNDRGTGLANGEIGLWLESAGGAAVFFPRPGLPDGWLRLPVSLLPEHEPGFAVTVHKSQGSEYDEVLLVLPEAGNRLLARETLYTAVTRARSAVRIFGTEAAIREAVERRMRRYGGMRGMMKDET